VGGGNDEMIEMEKDERILVLEEMICLLKEAMKGLALACAAVEDENQKSKLTGGLLVFEFVISLMRDKIELLGNDRIGIKELEERT